MQIIKSVTKIHNFFDRSIPLIETQIKNNNKLIGFMFHYNIKDYVYISQIRIDGKYRGMGLGKDMTQFDKICLFVQRDNIKGINFYKKNGFNEI